MIKAATPRLTKEIYFVIARENLRGSQARFGFATANGVAILWPRLAQTEVARGDLTCVGDGENACGVIGHYAAGDGLPLVGIGRKGFRSFEDVVTGGIDPKDSQPTRTSSAEEGGTRRNHGRNDAGSRNRGQPEQG